jgi:hypothetical protein
LVLCKTASFKRRKLYYHRPIFSSFYHSYCVITLLSFPTRTSRFRTSLLFLVYPYNSHS